MIREFVLLSFGLAVLAEWGVVPKSPEKRTAHVYCGEVLTATLNFICKGYFNSPFTHTRSSNPIRYSKKSNDYPFYLDYDSNDEMDEEKFTFNFPYSPKSKALSMLEYRRIKRGVHDECCKKSCSLNELQSYCGRNDVAKKSQ